MTQQNRQVHIPYAVGTAVAMILVDVVAKVAGGNSGIAEYLAFLPFLAGIIISCWMYSSANNRFVTFGQTFGSAFKTTALVIIILIAWTLASLYIWPNTETEMLAKISEEMERSKASQIQIDKTLEITKGYFKTFLIAGVVFRLLISGLIFSLIGASIAPKNGSGQRPEILDSPMNNRL